MFTQPKAVVLARQCLKTGRKKCSGLGKSLLGKEGASAGQKNQLSPDLRRPNLRLWYLGTRVQRAVMDRLITKDGGSGSSLPTSLPSQAQWVRRISDGGKGSIQGFIHWADIDVMIVVSRHGTRCSGNQKIKAM